MGANAKGTYTKTSLIFKTLIKYKANGRKLKEIAKDCGITYQSLANYRDGKTKPNKRDYEMIAMGFDVPVSFLDEQKNDIVAFLKNGEEDKRELMEKMKFDGFLAVKYNDDKKRSEVIEKLYKIATEYGIEISRDIREMRTRGNFQHIIEETAFFPFDTSVIEAYKIKDLYILYILIAEERLIEKSKIYKSQPLGEIMSNSKAFHNFTLEVFKIAEETRKENKRAKELSDIYDLKIFSHEEIDKIKASLNNVVRETVNAIKEVENMGNSILSHASGLIGEQIKDEVIKMIKEAPIKEIEVLAPKIVPKDETVITIRKIENASPLNGGYVYGAFNQHGTQLGGRYKTKKDCARSLRLMGFTNITNE